MDHVRGAPRYAGGAIVLHWLTAAAFAFQVGLGWRMGVSRGPDTFSAFQLHKSIGITILLLTIARIGWRLAYTPPPSAALRPIERHLAKAIHRGFYGLLLAMPLSGWLIVSSGKVAVPTLLYTIVPWPHVPGISGLSSAVRNAINAAASAAHVVMVWIALLAIALHVAGALKHQFADRTTDLARMVPVSPRLLGSAAIAIVVAFAGLMLWGRGGYPAEAPHDVTAPSPAVPTPTSPPGALASAAVPRPLPSETPVKQATMPGIAKPADWAVRMRASSIRFRTSWSQAPVEGGFDAWHAKIRFDPDALATSSAAITVDMASVTASDSSQQAALPGDDWFAATTHPTAVWRATRFRHLGGDRYKADGTLTLRGVSRPLPLGFTLTIAGDVAKMTGAVTIDRTVFGVGRGEWSATTDIPAAVAVRIAITADRVARAP